MKLTVAPKCPTCQSRAGIRRIAYGAALHSQDPARFIVAGMPSWHGAPAHACIDCGWQRPEASIAAPEDLADARDVELFDQHAQPAAAAAHHAPASWSDPVGGAAVA